MKKSERSDSYNRGREFESRIATIVRRKGFRAARDSKSGAGWNKSDVRVPGLNLHIEAKSHEKIRLPDFWAQTTEHAGFKTPVLMLDLGGREDLAVMRIEDFVDMLAVMRDDAEALTELRSKK